MKKANCIVAVRKPPTILMPSLCAVLSIALRLIATDTIAWWLSVPLGTPTSLTGLSETEWLSIGPDTAMVVTLMQRSKPSASRGIIELVGAQAGGRKVVRTTRQDHSGIPVTIVKTAGGLFLATSEEKSRSKSGFLRIEIANRISVKLSFLMESVTSAKC
jgi:hypothetical protein